MANEKFKDKYIRGAKRLNIRASDWLDDWFWGHGKDESCTIEGTWWDWICLARNILASENTKEHYPEWHRPEYENDNY